MGAMSAGSIGISYLVGTPRSLLSKLEQKLLDQPWEPVHEGMAVKLLPQDGELYVQAKSQDRQKKEQAMRRRKLKALLRGLNCLKRRAGGGKLSRDRLLKRVAILQKEAGRVAAFVKVREPESGVAVNRKTFTCTFDRDKWKQALQRDGCYIIPCPIYSWKESEGSWPAGLEKQAPVLWQWYMQLTHVEEAFKTLKERFESAPDSSSGSTKPRGVLTFWWRSWATAWRSPYA